MIRVGLTGGIATGKSTVARRWQDTAGIAVVDSDLLAHQTLTPDTPTWAAVVRVFGNEILNPDRTINRRELGTIVFHDEAKRTQLNHIIHPAVRAMWAAALTELARAGQSIAVVDIPLLYEVGAEKEFDCVVAVGASEATQIARLTAKDFDETAARARIRAQWPLQRKLDRADYVIWNDGSLPSLYQQADRVWQLIKETHHAPPQI